MNHLTCSLKCCLLLCGFVDSFKFSRYPNNWWCKLIHWGRVTHIYVSNLNIIGSDNTLSPGRRQAIIWTNDGILLIGPLGTNFSEILIAIYTFSFKKMHLKKSSGKWQPFCLGLNVLNWIVVVLWNLLTKWKKKKYIYGQSDRSLSVVVDWSGNTNLMCRANYRIQIPSVKWKRSPESADMRQTGRWLQYTILRKIQMSV